MKDTSSYALYFYILHVRSKKGNTFITTEINDLPQTMCYCGFTGRNCFVGNVPL